MSVRVMSLIWDGYPGGGSELLALLALADWSDDDGRCYPSMSAIADKIRLSRSQAQRVVHNLIDSGFVSVEGNETGGRPGSTRRYLINLQQIRTERGRTHATGSAYATGRTDAAEGSHGCAERGRTHATQTISEPSVNHQGIADEPPVSNKAADPSFPSSVEKKTAKSRLKELVTLQTFLEVCREEGNDAIPQNDPIFDYADKVGISTDMLHAAWSEFKARFQPTPQKQKDWRAHFRKAVRSNWYKLWYVRDGELAQWTTAGEQARRAAA